MLEGRLLPLDRLRLAVSSSLGLSAGCGLIHESAFLLSQSVNTKEKNTAVSSCVG